jgi:hypothetical protein
MTRKLLIVVALLCASTMGMTVTDETAHETVYDAPDVVKDVVKEDHKGDSKKVYESNHQKIIEEEQKDLSKEKPQNSYHGSSNSKND